MNFLPISSLPPVSNTATGARTPLVCLAGDPGGPEFCLDPGGPVGGSYFLPELLGGPAGGTGKWGMLGT